ncbi:LEAF RUST 10 DISEASE-RESISTANCE LOCUS RECEPTOR-LIKE PROTEIN KINASE-like 1.1 isoform X1 [Solanum stenotomum]|uniref:LEAF RUST 10 DISEASE-RESISTANCE LOCUS RECEPTOR-LIKE PROTEIN KINASE-like 1.1 isoform X1 n=1 Tax=Solanum stenotomum TaxID=172797 RepID=UPI0020D0931B|nr:LEAF RUST 10 DISEASE-RESISTANCE LOCUS RECEPTOR-LIKE PROTEIN KINASE-like 1.1 isoform X1 [Solanum stenotomum]
MSLASSSVCFILSLLVMLVQAKGRNDSTCPKTFSCGNLTDLSFPFSLSTQPDCGIVPISGCDVKPFPRVQLVPGGEWFYGIGKEYSYTVWVVDPNLQTILRKNKCQAFNENISLSDSPSISYTAVHLQNFFKCNRTSSNNPYINQNMKDHFVGYYSYDGCDGFTIYYKFYGVDDEDILAGNHTANCSLIRLPYYPTEPGNLVNFLHPEFLVEWKLSDDCSKCHYGGGRCQTDKKNNFLCYKDAKANRRELGLILGTVFGGVLVMITCLAVYFIWCYKKRKYNPPHFLSTRKLSYIFKNDVDGGSIYFGIPVFSYSELEEATNDFKSSRILGDGGFGTVYYGQLKDGREVAVKRLYEHNSEQMQQFVNEIEILTRLRHTNLVTLYGCTSRRSRELILVYEYIPNGTLADHLHGDRAKNRSLTWPVRLNIAIETAGALAYLHASDIIHCDVKTNNILLDQSFSVKVADFGISRLFPNDVSHISTAPRGTPGYIDPKYHECYELTIKSDVYSFGVVLVELISSMPAVDMMRHSQEINLASFAINKIVKCAFNELIDPSLGFDSDTKIWEMTRSVAELAFLCLQTDRDMRPTMTEVLDTLKEIQTSEFDNEKRAKLLLNQAKSQPSPNSVTDKWITCSSTIVANTK